MVRLPELPLDALYNILMILAMSIDGARHIAVFGAVCKKFRRYVSDPDLLRVVNFHPLTFKDHYSDHHHPRDLLWKCAYFENRGAKIMLGKAILCNESWSYRIEDSSFDVPYYGRRVLHPHLVVREFICYGTDVEIILMEEKLVQYLMWCVGLHMTTIFPILDAIQDMCSPRVDSLVANTRNLQTDDASVVSRGPNLVDREKVLFLYDQLIIIYPYV